MADLIDVYGHFASTFTTPEVAARVARMLYEGKRLGRVNNLDDTWAPRYAELRDWHGDEHATHAILFTRPRHYLSEFSKPYGDKRRVALYAAVSKRMTPEEITSCRVFDYLVTPSAWSKNIVTTAVRDSFVTTLPVGVSPQIGSARRSRFRDERPGMILHITTDITRKGTGQLLQAWKASERRRGPRLMIVAPSTDVTQLHYAVRDMDVDESVSVVSMDRHGPAPEFLVPYLAAADLMVQPSVAEATGAVQAMALLAGIPLLTTYGTGQAEVLAGRAAGWLPVPTVSDVYGGQAVEVEMLGEALRRALSSGTQDAVRDVPGPRTWPQVLPEWMAWIQQWIEETTT